MGNKVWAWIKNRPKEFILGLLGIIGLLFLGRKPRWERQMVQGVKEREKSIERVRGEREKLEEEADKLQGSLPDFEEVVKEQDEKIAEAGAVEKPDPLDNPSDIADFIRDRGGRK